MTEPSGRYTSIKEQRGNISFCYHVVIVSVCLGGFILGLLLTSREMSLLFSGLLIMHVLTFRLNPLEKKLQQWLITEAHCPGCGHVIDLITPLWKCSCGFNVHRPRHAFSPCPSCKRVYRWIDCPYCETSVPI